MHSFCATFLPSLQTNSIKMTILRPIILVLVVFLTTHVCIGQQQEQQLSIYIDSLYLVDQNVLGALSTSLIKGDKEEIKRSLINKTATLERHTGILKKIVQKYGYPTVDLVGKESANNFFLMVQHSDSDIGFQSKMLLIIEEEVNKGNIEGRAYAFLTDRVLLAKGKPQLYGTQLDYDKKGNAFSKNLDASEDCDARREKYGLEPLDEYLTFSTELHKKMNPNKYSD